MIKFRLYFDKDKETIWLNEMAAQGYALTGFCCGFYHFVETEPGKYTYQIDFGDRPFSASRNYREFMEDTGVEIVQCWGFWVILRKAAEKGVFQLYTDIDSSLKHYTKVRNMFKITTLIELLCFIVEFVIALDGYVPAIICMFLIGAVVLATLNAATKAAQVVAELKERKGEPASVLGLRNPKASRPLVSGMLLNLCATATRDSVSCWITMLLHIAAIAIMLIGLYHSRHVFKK